MGRGRRKRKRGRRRLLRHRRQAFPAFHGADRQDVADSSGVTSYRYSGFERAIPLSEIGAGLHELSVIVLTADKTEYYQPGKKVSLEVR
jgi:hypothetical protein